MVDCHSFLDLFLHPSTHSLDGCRFRAWNKSWPFIGKFRVFECKNEDNIKFIQFGALVKAPSSQDHAILAASQTAILDCLPTATAPAATNVFLLAVSQGSTSPTKLVFPSYRSIQSNHSVPILGK